MIRASILALVLGCAAACGPQEDAAPAAEEVAAAMPQNAEEATAQDTCAASQYQNLIGTRLDAINPATLPAGTRLLTPESIVTQDFRPDRLNVMSGADGLVSSLACY